MKKLLKGLIGSLIAVQMVFAPFSVLPTETVYAATDVSTHPTLTTSLLSYWELEEASGSRIDSDASNDLTDFNSTGQTTGKQGNAASMSRASSQGLYISSGSQSPDLSIGSGDLNVAGWFKLDSKPSGQMGAVVKYEFSNGLREYWLYWDNSSDRFKFQVFNNTVSSNVVTANSFGAPSTGTWYFVQAYVDNTGNQIGISVNDGTVDTASLTVTTHNGGAQFALGFTGTTASSFTHWDGDMDEVGLWNKTLSTSEVSDLYNSGSGLPWEAAAAATTTVETQDIYWFH